MGVPLALGKPVQLLNAFYQLALDDASIQLKIVTGLTLARPILHHTLEKRFVEPIMNRLLKDYEDPLYEKARVLQQLPKNVQVLEFFLSPGKYLYNANVQENYISSNYSFITRDAAFYSINVLAQQFARGDDNYSVSCNADLFFEMQQILRKANYKTAIVAEINENLPFMHGEYAVFPSDTFTDILDPPNYRNLFAIPKDKISVEDHLIGIYGSTQIQDNSCLQVGIGKLSNSLANALIFRHKHNDVYISLLKELQFFKKYGEEFTLQPFEKGLYASTEMFSDEYIELYKEKILKKRVYDHIGLQRLLNEGKISEKVTPDFLEILQKNGIISSPLTKFDIAFLQKFGILDKDMHLGNHLKAGKILHAGFFLGSKDLYATLKNLSPAELIQFEMTTIKRTNTLDWSYELSQLQRKYGRYINSCMMITLNGNVISDSLQNMQEVSGVGGQFDLTYMAHKIEEARAIINCRSTRMHKNKITSNILWDYSNATLPRHLRDIFITEYGIADCRSKTDTEVMKAILNITDSTFQESLLLKAKKYGKVVPSYEIPKYFKENYLAKIRPVIKELQSKGFCKPYPFGCDLTNEELVLEKILLKIKNYQYLQLAVIIFKALLTKLDMRSLPYLKRMSLDKPQTFKDFIYYKIFNYMLIKSGNG
jgi:acyl-CoA hydrolase